MTDTLLTLFFLGVLLIITGGTGRYLLQRLGCSFTCKTEELSFSFAVGFGTLILVVLAMGLSHLLYVGAIYAIILTWMVVGSKQSLIFLGDLKQRLIAYRVDHRSFYFWLAILTALGMGLTLIRALTPPYGATDPLAYQMALPKIFLRNHYLSFESTITGSLYPTNMGMLYIVALALRDGTLAQMMHWLMGILCLGALIGFGTRYFSRETGIWAAAIFSFIPVIVIFGPLGYVDVGLCFFQFMAFWAIANWLDQPDRPMLLLAGILTGLAMGFKHQGIATVFVG